MLATNPKIFMLWPKKNNENEKKFLRLENPPPPSPTTPIMFLMVRP